MYPLKGKFLKIEECPKKYCIKFIQRHELENDPDSTLEIMCHHYLDKYIEEDRCIDCVQYVVTRSGRHFERMMNRKNYSLWFKAIQKGRYDIILDAFLLKGGFQEYKECRIEGHNSISWLMLHRRSMDSDIFTKIFILFISIRIPIENISQSTTLSSTVVGRIIQEMTAQTRHSYIPVPSHKLSISKHYFSGDEESGKTVYNALSYFFKPIDIGP